MNAAGVYVHFPWCVRKCPYCDFNSHPMRGPLPEDAYLNALLADLHADCQRFDVWDAQTVYFGGGTPSLFSPPTFRRLLSAIPGDAEEVTMEANPGAREHGDFHAYRQAGVTRISLGAQSFDPAQLQRLGRIHDANGTRAAAAQVAKAGFASFNLDLMHGLPGQSVAEALRDLEEAIRLNPPHLSWYQLTIEAKTEFARQPPKNLPNDEQAVAIEEAGLELLARHGYRRYEVSAFARPGHECRHNLNYWTFGDYLGIGAGAHGKRTVDGEILRIVKPASPRLYLRGEPARVRQVPSEEQATEFMMNVLRLADGVPRALFQERTALDFDAIAAAVQELVDWGLMRPDRLALTARGWRQLDGVVARFLPAARGVAGSAEPVLVLTDHPYGGAQSMRR